MACVGQVEAQAAAHGEAEAAAASREEGVMSGDWVPCRDYAFTVTVGPASDYHLLLVRHGDDILEVPAVSTVEATAELVVERVVGQVDLEAVNETQARVAMRLRVALYDDQSDQLAFYADSLFDGQEANEPFLWQRYVRCVASDGGALRFGANPWWGSLDVRVARKLARDQALVLTFQTLVGSVRVTPYLRSWARIKGHRT